MRNLIRSSALALAATGMAVSALPAAAADFGGPAHGSMVASAHDAVAYGDRWERGRYRDDRRYRDYGRDRSYGEPVYRNSRSWQGRDGNYYCQRKDGTTGLIVGGAVGALLGREVDSRGDRTLGTLLGGAAGALLGKQVATGGSRCR